MDSKGTDCMEDSSTSIINAHTSPWTKQPTVGTCSLSEVMSEQLAEKLQEANEIEADKQYSDYVDPGFVMGNVVDTSNDYLIAQMIQHEFDKEHDQEVKLKESKFNADSKVRLSFDNHRAVHPSLWEDDDEPREEVMERQEFKEQQRNFRGRGVSGKGKDIVTKHDAGINQRKNASKATDQLPPEIRVGDGHDLKLPNKVYNKLRTYSKAEVKKTQKLHEKKDHSTAEHSMDPKTRLILYKLVNSGVLEDVNGVISVGKESVVFHADATKDMVLPYDNDKTRGIVVPSEVAIKVFKTTLADFKNRANYVKGDFRFFKDEFKKQNPRKIMKIWAEKESLNLRRMARHGIPCPRVVQLRKHVLLMTFIGRNRVAAPKLKDAQLSVVDLQIAYDQIVQNMKTMYRTCHLVHSDLSEYNLLWLDGTVYVIDVSQAVDRLHPHAHEFLLRDCRNISQFFKKSGAVDIPDEHALFNEITGFALKGEGKEFLLQIQDYEKHENTMRLGTSRKDDNFDFFFEHAVKSRETDSSSSPPAASAADATTDACASLTNHSASRVPAADVSDTDDVTCRDGEWELVDDDAASSSDDDDIEVLDDDTLTKFDELLDEHRRVKVARLPSEMGESFLKVSFRDDANENDCEAADSGADIKE